MSSYIGVRIMYITARERQILEFLLDIKVEVTVSELAKRIGVSGRTIHRDLKNIEDILVEYDLSLIKKSGLGILIIGDKHKMLELELLLHNSLDTEYTPEERQTIMLCELLDSKEPVKLVSLANDLNVTIATVSADLTKLEEKLKKYNLSLIRKRGYGVEIVGEEGAIRKAMKSLISEYINESDMISLARENIQGYSTKQIDMVSERLLGFVEKQKLFLIEKVVNSVLPDLPYRVADSAYVGLIVHLALAVERIQKGEGIQMKAPFLESQMLSKEYNIAERIVVELESLFQINIPQAEIAHITMHLRGAKLRNNQVYLVEDSDLEIERKVKELIRIVELRVGKNISNNYSLLQGLVMHLKPAIYRIKENMGISNPLLEKIKADYSSLFNTIKEIIEVNFPDLEVPEEEIGYLVLHFGSAIMNNSEYSQLKIVVVCSSGIGTSKMLVTRLRKEFPELKDIKNLSVMEFNKLNKEEFNLIISTIAIPELNESEYIIVSPFLNQYEIEEIKLFIAGYRLSNPTEYKEDTIVSKKSTELFLKELNSIQEYSNTIEKIIRGFEIRIIENRENKEQMLYEICEYLAVNSKVKNPNNVVQAIIDREEKGGIGIPETEIALYHTRAMDVLEPVFVMYVLKYPIQIKGMDNNEMFVRHLVVMLTPIHSSKETLEVLSFISSIIIESDENIQCFQLGNTIKIRELITRRFDEFFHEKLLEIRSV